MGKITLYSELLLGFHGGYRYLNQRCSCLLDLSPDPNMFKVDWFIWWYLLLELVVKEILTALDVRLDSSKHNAISTFYTMAIPSSNQYNPIVYKMMCEILGIDDIRYSDYNTYFQVKYSSLRYVYNYLETVGKPLDRYRAEEILTCALQILNFAETKASSAGKGFYHETDF